MKQSRKVLTVVNKQAWIDSARRIVSFQQISDAECFIAEESAFWGHIMRLVGVGYRLQ